MILRDIITFLMWASILAVCIIIMNKKERPEAIIKRLEETESVLSNKSNMILKSQQMLFDTLITYKNLDAHIVNKYKPVYEKINTAPVSSQLSICKELLAEHARLPLERD